MSSSFISSFSKAIKDSKGSTGERFLPTFYYRKYRRSRKANAEFITKVFHSELKLQLSQCQIVIIIRAHIENAFTLAVWRPPCRGRKYGITLDKTRAAVEKFGSSATINMNAVAAVSVTTGAAILGLSKALEKLGIINDKAAKTLQGIGSALMFAGSLLPIIAKGARIRVSFTTAGVTIGKAGALASIPGAGHSYSCRCCGAYCWSYRFI